MTEQTEKCWCGKELVVSEWHCSNCGELIGTFVPHENQHWVLRDPADPNSGEPCGGIVCGDECPDHGEGCVWRPCVFAEPPGEVARVCMYWERNGVEGAWETPAMMPDDCAICHIPDDHRDAELWRKHGPALVEAVKDAREGCWLRGDRDYCRKDWWCKPEQCKLYHALAALPKKEEESR